MSYKSLPGWASFTPTYDAYLHYFAKPGDVVVEVGVFCGRSLCYLTSRAREMGKAITVYGVDPWEADNGDDNRVPQSHAKLAASAGGPFALAMRAMLSQAPADLEVARIIRAPSLQAARMFDPGSLAMVMIDGSHAYEDVRADILTWMPLVRDGGILAGDDYGDGHPGVPKAVLEVLGEGHFEVTRDGTWRTNILAGKPAR